MPTIATFLLSITGSVVARVLFTLGFGIVSYAALTTLTDTVISLAMSNYQSINPKVLQLLNLGGIGQSLGIITAGMTTRAALMAIKKLRPI
ncbi:DUF2523 domain-containing protein [Methylobacter sp.]|uniref:DUF2523 domain-containing protein n=1 Tax=Methylobacter sp. TaxID=2051955 RepID=UPI002FDD4607